MKQFIKRGLSLGLVMAGRMIPVQGTPILTYHSVDRTGSAISTPPEFFEAQMAHLSRSGYRTISLSTFLQNMEGGNSRERLGEKRVVLTFDDGYRNNYTAAFPILREFGFTATFFLAVDYVGKMGRWRRDPSIEEMPLFSWDEAREMEVAGMEFGAHTLTHADLTALSVKDAEREIAASRARIEDRLGRRVDGFCYPYGRFSSLIEAMVRDLGFAGACSVRYGIRNRHRDRYCLRRIGTGHFTSLLDFEAGILGTYGAYVGLRDGLRAAC